MRRLGVAALFAATIWSLCVGDAEARRFGRRGRCASSGVTVIEYQVVAPKPVATPKPKKTIQAPPAEEAQTEQEDPRPLTTKPAKQVQPQIKKTPAPVEQAPADDDEPPRPLKKPTTELPPKLQQPTATPQIPVYVRTKTGYRQIGWIDATGEFTPLIERIVEPTAPPRIQAPPQPAQPTPDQKAPPKIQEERTPTPPPGD